MAKTKKPKQKVEIDDYGTITSCPLFDYFDILLTDREKWDALTDKIKKDHFFMLQRRIAISFPALVQKLNLNGISEVDVSNMYHHNLYNPGYKAGTKRKPNWLYAKADKMDKSLGGIQLTVDKDSRNFICKVFELGHKSFDSILKRNPEWVMVMVEMYELSKKNKLNSKELKSI